MKLTLTINLTGAALEGDAQGPETARMLRGLADQLEDQGELDSIMGGTMRDAKGNRAGSWGITDDERNYPELTRGRGLPERRTANQGRQYRGSR